MPGPPVGTILTSNDVGLGTFEMKVKGTYSQPYMERFLRSRYLFVSKEEEAIYFKNNPNDVYISMMSPPEGGKPKTVGKTMFDSNGSPQNLEINKPYQDAKSSSVQGRGVPNPRDIVKEKDTNKPRSEQLSRKNFPTTKTK